MGMNGLQELPSAYTQRRMEWLAIRNRFIRLREARDLTQQEVAEKGKIKQGAISKLESNLNQGPSVETFVKAVEGLGLTLTEFFAQIERRSPKADLKTDTLKPTVVSSGPPPSLSEHSDPQLVDLARACLEAAEHMDRGVTRRILAELAFAFGMAADSSDQNRSRLIDQINKRIG
jgi:transcriptional regulator with XRE-family HTH domain